MAAAQGVGGEVSSSSCVNTVRLCRSVRRGLPIREGDRA